MALTRANMKHDAQYMFNVVVIHVASVDSPFLFPFPVRSGDPEARLRQDEVFLPS